MAESTQPTQVVYLERPPPSSAAGGLAPGTHSSPPQSFCHAERLNEEPDMGKPFVRFCEGCDTRSPTCLLCLKPHSTEWQPNREERLRLPASRRSGARVGWYGKQM